MKAFIVLLMLFTVATGVLSAGTMMGDQYASFGMALCPVSLISLLLFLVLAARQSRKDREAREERLFRQRYAPAPPPPPPYDSDPDTQYWKPKR